MIERGRKEDKESAELKHSILPKFVTSSSGRWTEIGEIAPAAICNIKSEGACQKERVPLVFMSEAELRE